MTDGAAFDLPRPGASRVSLQLQSLWRIPAAAVASWPTAAVPMENSCCSCKLTRVRPATAPSGGGGGGGAAAAAAEYEVAGAGSVYLNQRAMPNYVAPLLARSPPPRPTLRRLRSRTLRTPRRASPAATAARALHTAHSTPPLSSLHAGTKLNVGALNAALARRQASRARFATGVGGPCSRRREFWHSAAPPSPFQ